MAFRELTLVGDTVDRGTPVTLTAVFSADPVEVYASFMKPGSGRSIVDPGFGQSGSRLRRMGPGVYTYVIDTTGFSAGKVEWHVWGTGDASRFGWFTINDAPAQLL